MTVNRSGRAATPRATSSASSGSWTGTASPDRAAIENAATFAVSTSTHTTGWPRWARHAALAAPT
ncbi:hypothetical protein SAMN05421810_10654 [Amycolatopsis arida]|uniref:Uncharacterized protein n=1 Tax=Amycolatopsis arida TaxID=587909 RepID=A0A1I5XH67_9PSEU|nr:hypothetical protein CLV69_102567 [Amycolatopsis arida]SFQ31146.1 hypothetical protein SAMN05421810_10654 [Amycolatopsis arida]